MRFKLFHLAVAVSVFIGLTMLVHSDSGNDIWCGGVRVSGALTATTTITLLYTDDATACQAKINAAPKFLNGQSLIFQFSDPASAGGTQQLTSALTFSGFYGDGTLYIQGNVSEANAATLHATQTVTLNFGAGTSNGIILSKNYCNTVVRDLKINVADAAVFNLYILKCAGAIEASYNYFTGTGKTAANKGIFSQYTPYVYVDSNYFSNLQDSIVSSVGSRMIVIANDDTSTQPTYGLATVTGSDIIKISNSITGSTADERGSGTNGGLIR